MTRDGSGVDVEMEAEPIEAAAKPEVDESELAIPEVDGRESRRRRSRVAGEGSRSDRVAVGVSTVAGTTSDEFDACGARRVVVRFEVPLSAGAVAGERPVETRVRRCTAPPACEVVE